MKICTKCNVEKPLDDFHWRSKAKGTKQAQCKPCKNGYHLNHIKVYRERSRQRNKAWRTEFREYLCGFLSENPCIDCGESDIRVLEFDHRDDEEKLYTVAEMGRGDRSLDKVASEIAKCDIRCVNCHRVRTAIQSNRWRPEHGNRGIDFIYRNRKYAWEFRENNPCAKCGESNPIKLGFDYLDRSSKTARISQLITRVSLEKLKAEIDKCQVLCGNCHRLKTYKQLDWNEPIQ